MYTFVLRAEIATFSAQIYVVAISARNTKVYKICYVFRILQHFATKLCNVTHFSMLFVAVEIYLHLLA
jgi:hypothetical protein